MGKMNERNGVTCNLSPINKCHREICAVSKDGIIMVCEHLILKED